jgi:hypothetical protein
MFLLPGKGYLTQEGRHWVVKHLLSDSVLGFLIKNYPCQVWWLKPVILATCKTEIGKVSLHKNLLSLHLNQWLGAVGVLGILTTLTIHSTQEPGGMAEIKCVIRNASQVE